MKLLAFESATEACSVALYVNGEVREQFELAARRHTQLLLPMAYGLLSEAGIGLPDLDLLAFGQGPGSFTGLRIAVGAIQGLAMGLDRPVIGVSTLAAMAARCMRTRDASQVAVALDARMNQVYWGEYVQDASGQCKARIADSLRDPGQVTKLVDGHWLPAGIGWQRYGEILSRASGLLPDTARMELYPHAEEVAYLATELARQGTGVPAALAQPVYLRQQVAEKMKTAGS